jgi:hypothetical protein
MSNCPHCGVSLIGPEIPEKDRELFGGATHFQRQLVRVWKDRAREATCPDCKKVIETYG